MHIVSIAEKPTSTTTENRRGRLASSAKNDEIEKDRLPSVAEKRNLFEQLMAKSKINGSPISPTRLPKRDQQSKQPPPKPQRTFAHDQYLSAKQIVTTPVDELATATKSSLSISPNSKSKPPIVLRKQNRLKSGTGKIDFSYHQGVSHEYEHILADRSPMVLRQKHLRRSLSDDPLAYAQSAPLKITPFDIDVAPLYYASSPVPRPKNNDDDDRIYDTPTSSNNNNHKSKSPSSKLRRRPRDSLPLNRERSEDQENREEIDTDLSAMAIDKRVNRARLMRRRTLMHYDQQEIAFIKRRLPQLFELAALVRLEPNDGSNPMLSSDQKYAPSVVYRFPPENQQKSEEGSITASLSCLCYPDISKAVLASPETYKDEQFVMTITDQFGDRKFAYCYRFVPMATVIERSNDRLSPTGKVIRIGQHQGASTFFSNEIVLNGLPQVFCVVTPVQAPNFYQDFVREAAMKAKRMRIDQDKNKNDLEELVDFLQETFWKPLPPPGGRLVVNGRGWEKETVITHRVSTSRGIVNGLSNLVARIGVDHSILLFTALLSERRVLLVGESVPAVAKAVQAAAALLAPFEWPHTLVPVVPDPYVHLCFSPTPYLMGLLRSNLHHLKDLLVGRRPSSALDGCQANDEDEEYILILDLDYGILKDKDFNDEPTNATHRCLPSRTSRTLKTNLRNAVASHDDDATATATSTSLTETKDANAAEAFLTTFLDLIGHYREYLATQQDGHVTFQKQQFVNEAATESQRSFLKWFVETGMFQVWLKKKLDSALTGGVDGQGGRSLTLGAATASDAFDRKLTQMKSRPGQGNAAYQLLLNAVARRWSSFLKRTK